MRSIIVPNLNSGSTPAQIFLDSTVGVYRSNASVNILTTNPTSLVVTGTDSVDADAMIQQINNAINSSNQVTQIIGNPLVAAPSGTPSFALAKLSGGSYVPLGATEPYFGNPIVQITFSSVASPRDNYPILGYNVYRSTDNVNYTLVGTTATTTFNDTTITQGGAYWYAVTAFTSGRESDKSASNQFTCYILSSPNPNPFTFDNDGNPANFTLDVSVSGWSHPAVIGSLFLDDAAGGLDFDGNYYTGSSELADDTLIRFYSAAVGSVANPYASLNPPVLSVGASRDCYLTYKDSTGVRSNSLIATIAPDPAVNPITITV
jgi:hypothetical protein